MPIIGLDLANTSNTFVKSKSNNSLQRDNSPIEEEKEGENGDIPENSTIILVDQNFNILNSKDIKLNLNFDHIPSSQQVSQDYRDKKEIKSGTCSNSTMGENMRNAPRVWEGTKDIQSPGIISDSGSKKPMLEE